MIEGTCHYCGLHRKLSKEHVPPKAAFNKGKLYAASGTKCISIGPEDRIYGRQYQGGFFVETVCESCNNSTGDWYADDYGAWAFWGAEHLALTKGKPELFYIYHCYPLRVIKQVVAMFLAINNSQFGDKNEDLRRFVLQRYARGLPPGIRIYAYYVTSNKHRLVGETARGDLLQGNIHIFSEINSFPLGYVLTINSSPPDRRLKEITHFAKFGYLEFTDVNLQLPVLPINLALPGDYRSKDEISADLAASKEPMKQPMLFTGDQHRDIFKSQIEQAAKALDHKNS